jgi:solute:Na+ symporter, SSS family
MKLSLVVIGVIIGVLLITWMSLSPIYFTEGRLLAFRSPFHSNLTIAFGTAVIFMEGFLLNKMLRGTPMESQPPNPPNGGIL